ncbi:pyridoxamine 5'-phosphate oxidase family protein [Aromatoleum bremense]|uniref:Pyridoxamine 5'-phosphate oxidase n=1 Tax=Aromatoleum bremense TaxID=76115 RepID=A0ABX1NUS4_9RHOO|nr:pyridoxamine 5'-phosphate oxidase family protein [Aromatoleum bremense]NMG15764.1 pyridoxamine 5'-phosphate oxidase [Aromatoleum bremense]
MQTDPRNEPLTYLEHHHVMTLATQGPEGPWAAAVFYVNDGADLYFLSAPSTRHARNLERDPRVAATVQEDYSEWQEIRGIQLEGEALRLNALDSVRAANLFARKFTFTTRDHMNGAIAAAMNKIAWYRLRPARLYFIDNSRGLGCREQFDVASVDRPKSAAKLSPSPSKTT